LPGSAGGPVNRRLQKRGNVDEQVEATLLPFNLIDRRSQRRLIGQIEMYGSNIARAGKFGCSSDPLFRVTTTQSAVFETG
jgi:hypothetical protein